MYNYSDVPDDHLEIEPTIEPIGTPQLQQLDFDDSMDKSIEPISIFNQTLDTEPPDVSFNPNCSSENVDIDSSENIPKPKEPIRAPPETLRDYLTEPNDNDRASDDNSSNIGENQNADTRDDDDDEDDDPLKCKTCGKKFCEARRRRRHEKLHLSVKPHSCDLCGKGFNERSDLKRHVAKHTKIDAAKESIDYAYKCVDCDVGFIFEKDLGIHSSIHTKNGVFSCVECKKVCKSKFVEFISNDLTI